MSTMTHEQFVRGVAEASIAYAVAKRHVSAEEIETLNSIKLVYGAGQAGLRGVTYYHKWNGKGSAAPAPFVEVCAFGQESWVQVAGTTIHELGHVLAGFSAGHDKEWKRSCERLGIRRVKAAGTAYCLAMFAPEVRAVIASMSKPDEGEPVETLLTGPRGGAPKGCVMGIGTHGGKSRGAGSGSRLRLFECECVPAIKVRAARDNLAAHCDCCTAPFHFVK